MNRLRLNQIRGMLRLELRKNLLSVRALPVYLLAALPVGVVVLIVLISALLEPPPELLDPAGASLFFAILYQFILRFVVYFGCMWAFMNLFRGEVMDRSLHYYFLSPVRRDVLVAGKYLSALVATVIVFGASTTFVFAVIRGYPGLSGLLEASTIGMWLSYMAVTTLACVGYGAAFLLLGLLLRNPLVPAIVIFFWETAALPLLPAALKKISVMFYLQSLFPVPVDEGPFAIIVDPAPVWVGVLGLPVFTTLLLFIAGWRVRRMEIVYAAD